MVNQVYPGNKQGGSNTPKPGEQGFQLSKAGKTNVPTSMPLVNNTGKDELTIEANSDLVVPDKFDRYIEAHNRMADYRSTHPEVPETIAEAKARMVASGGLLKGENLNDGLARLDPDSSFSKAEAFELSRLKSMKQGGRTCHDCSCHINPPCYECVECLICNEESMRELLLETYDETKEALFIATESDSLQDPIPSCLKLEKAFELATQELFDFDQMMYENRKKVGLDSSEKKKINNISLEDMIRKIRFSPIGDVFFRHEDDPRLEYFMEQFNLRKNSDSVAFTEASKRIGF